MRTILFLLIGAVIVGLWARSAFAEKKLAEKRKQQEETPEINRHPERKEQMLDPTDDA